MNPDLKNSMSHRGRAVEKLVRFLLEEYPYLPDR
jgi:inosine/xanthosine triphosphate pyrophosphatase family protein